MRHSIFLQAGVALAAFAADRTTKAAALALPEEIPHRLLPGIVQLRRTWNRGVAFSLMEDSRIGPIALAALLIGVLVVWLALDRALPRGARCGLCAALGGAVGNLADRLLYGAVIDFIEPLFVPFAVFNVADAAICIGVFAAMISLIRKEKGASQT